MSGLYSQKQKQIFGLPSDCRMELMQLKLIVLFAAFGTTESSNNLESIVLCCSLSRGGGGVLPYMGHIGMCRCEGYNFNAVYSSIEYINQIVWV